LQLILWFFIFTALAVKVPIFPFHIWLPEAHVEAPTVGSVILASLILKLGTYGIARILLPIFPYSCKFLSPVVNSLCFLGILYGSLVAIRQIDFKKIIAYSSIVHMNYIVVGLFSFNGISYIGSIYMMVAQTQRIDYRG
jgi:NADH-quinone oxidoreductase subunit M